MKKLLILIFFITLFRGASAQVIVLSHNDLNYFVDTIEFELKDQLPDGKYQIYFDDAHKIPDCIGEISRSKRIKKWSWFFESGVKRLEINYEEGILHGQFTSYYPSGKNGVVIKYENGLREGSSTGWYPNGSKLFEGMYEKGNPIGKWKFYNEDGSIFKEEDKTYDIK